VASADVGREPAPTSRSKAPGPASFRRLSQATMGNIRQNLFFAFVYNALGVPVAAGALYPFFEILLSPMIAAAAMALSSGDRQCGAASIGGFRAGGRRWTQGGQPAFFRRLPPDSIQTLKGGAQVMIRVRKRRLQTRVRS
jgi:hypothetical protein